MEPLLLLPPPPQSLRRCPHHDHNCPNSIYDWLLLSFALAATIPFLVANITVFRFRKRPYFRAQGGADLILASSLAGQIWISVNFVINLHFQRDLPFLKRCSLWTFWLQLTFGFCLWLVCVSLRLYRLYVLCTRNHYLTSLRTWIISIPLLLSPSFIFCAIATSLPLMKYGPPKKHGLIQDISIWNCSYTNNGGRISTFVILPPLYFSTVVVLLFCLRGQKDYMLRTEYRHTSEHCMMAFVIYLLTGVTYLTELQNFVFGRAFLTFCVCYLVFSHFWVRMARPVYLCLFKGESEMDHFEDDLMRWGAECLDKLKTLQSPRRQQSSTSFSQTQQPDGDWIVRAIADAMVELAECKVKFEQVQQKVIRLRTKLEESDRRLRSSSFSSLEPPMLLLSW